MVTSNDRVCREVLFKPLLLMGQCIAVVAVFGNGWAGQKVCWQPMSVGSSGQGLRHQQDHGSCCRTFSLATEQGHTRQEHCARQVVILTPAGVAIAVSEEPWSESVKATRPWVPSAAIGADCRVAGGTAQSHTMALMAHLFVPFMRRVKLRVWHFTVQGCLLPWHRHRCWVVNVKRSPETAMGAVHSCSM